MKFSNKPCHVRERKLAMGVVNRQRRPIEACMPESITNFDVDQDKRPLDKWFQPIKIKEQ